MKKLSLEALKAKAANAVVTTKSMEKITGGVLGECHTCSNGTAN